MFFLKTIYFKKKYHSFVLKNFKLIFLSIMKIILRNILTLEMTGGLHTFQHLFRKVFELI